MELHFSPGVKGVGEEENAPTGFGFRPASSEVAVPTTTYYTQYTIVLHCYALFKHSLM